MITTIIKCQPGEHRGRLRGYTITTIRDGVRSTYAVIALNGRQALDAARSAMVETLPRSAA
jgi:hypothetical protein